MSQRRLLDLKSIIILLILGFFLLPGAANVSADPINIGSPTLPKMTVGSSQVKYQVLNSTSGKLTITGGSYAYVDIPGTTFIPTSWTYNLQVNINRTNPHASTGNLTVNMTIKDKPGYDAYDAYDDYLEYFGKYGGYPSGKLVGSTKLAGFGWDGQGSSGIFEFLFNNNTKNTDWYGLDAYAYVLAPVYNLSIGGIIGDWDVNFKNKLFGINWSATSQTQTWVPLPAAGLLLGSGIVILGGWLRRRQHLGNSSLSN